MAKSSCLVARLLTIVGQVQGVGFRPFVARLAHKMDLTGWVLNKAGHVEIFIQGDGETLDVFVSKLGAFAPPLAKPVISQIQDCSTEDCQGFNILTSQPGDLNDAHVPPDYFICQDCLEEMRDPTQRRYRYPFINCTQCGPRYTLINKLPYDRVNSSMAAFQLCSACVSEYENSLDRRFHAQPLACPTCGPILSFKRLGEKTVETEESALHACIEALHAGQIVAVKGVGGYHLLCNARSDEAVKRLRARKRRPSKPLAVLLPWRGESGLDAVNELSVVNSVESALLTDPLRPIVLIEKRSDACLSREIAPGLNEIGVLLPYSPLHYLLSDGFSGPLVATSANISGEPVMTDNDEVEQRLSTVADAFLHHNRPILRPADDAIFRSIAGKMRPIRIGRGCAPLEISLPLKIAEPILAVGAHMKNTVALAWDDRVVISPHIGDLGSRRSQEIFERTICDIAALYGVEIKRVIRDAHPDYRSSRWAEQSGLPTETILHHHAHASALLGEHRLFEPALVFAWDGTGYGEDGTIWGGETLLGSPGAWRRVGTFRSFGMPGGDGMSRQPWRIAQILCWEMGLEWRQCPFSQELFKYAWQNKVHASQCSSVGRLFDAASALLGFVLNADYEGQGPMGLEAAASIEESGPCLPLYWQNDCWICDWAPLVPMLLDDTLSVQQRAGQFHASLVDVIVRQSLDFKRRCGISSVGLCGGVFQNKKLTEQVVSRLDQHDFQVYLSEAVPCNDAGISFGQIIEAIARQANRHDSQ